MILYFCVYTYFYEIPGEHAIGYIDYTNYVNTLDRVVQGKVYFKDFYWWYGPLHLYIMAPFYYLFGKNHFALLMIHYEVIPPLCILMSYFYIKLLVKSPFLRILFVAVGLLQNLTSDLSALRHIGAELAIASFFFSVSRSGEKKFSVLSGCFTGIALLLGTEYGVAALLAISAAFLFCLFCKDYRISHLLYFAFGLIVGLAPFITYMLYHDALDIFLKTYYSAITGGVGAGNAAHGTPFPIFPQITLTTPRLFIESICEAIISQNFRFYLPIITYVAALTLFLIKFIKEWSVSSIVYFVLGIYGLMIFYRVLGGPAYGYLITYAVTPSIILGFLWLELIQNRTRYYFENRSKKTDVKYFVGYALWLASIVAWIFVTAENKVLFSFNGGNPPYNREGIYYDKVGMIISKESYEQYSQINDFIEQNTKPGEYLLVYPWGYYNHFTGRPSPFITADAKSGITQLNMFDYAVKQLDEHKPKYIVVNIFNDLGTTHVGGVRGDVAAQVSWRTEEGLVFNGNGNPVEIYILENYHIIKKFRYAVILEKNAERKPFVRKFRETDIIPPSPGQSYVDKTNYSGVGVIGANNSLKIESRKFKIEYIFNTPLPATHVKIKYRIKTSFLKKFFTAGIMRFGIVNSERSQQFTSNFNDLADIGKIKSEWLGVYVPLAEVVKDIHSFWIEYETPKPYLMADELEILDLKLLFDEAIVPDGANATGKRK